MIDPADNSLIGTLKYTGVIGFIIAVFRYVIEDNHGGWSGFFRGAAASIIVAILVGFVLGDSSFKELTKAALIGITAYIADDILIGLRKLTKSIKDDPLGSLREIITIWRGR